MPQVIKAIGNTYETITRPVVFGVAKDALKSMGFDKDAFLSFDGFVEQSINQENELEKITKKNFFGSDTLAEIEITESPQQDMLYTMSVLRPDQLCVFRDEKSGLFIRPVKQITRVEVDFKLRFKNKTEAKRWRDDLHSRLNLLRTQAYHRAVYSYPIPPVIMQFLYDVHQENIVPHDANEEQDFADYFFKYADKRATTLTTGAGKEHMLVIPETQTAVLGQYNFTEIADAPTYDKDKGTWEVSWQYVFNYDKVIECVLFHELVVRQTPIPALWYPQAEYVTEQEDNVAMNNANAIHEWFHPTRFNMVDGIFNNRTHPEDTWYPLGSIKTDLRNYNPVFIANVVLNKDGYISLDLQDIGDNWKLKEETLKLLKSDFGYVTDIGESILNISIFGDDFLAYGNQQSMDENLVLRSTQKLSPVPVYRVVISVVKDLHLLSPGAQTRTRLNACATKELLELLYTKLKELQLLPRPTSQCRWTQEQWEYVKDLLQPPESNKPWPWGWPPKVPGVPGFPGAPNQPGVAFEIWRQMVVRTVGFFTIISKRSS